MFLTALIRCFVQAGCHRGLILPFTAMLLLAPVLLSPVHTQRQQKIHKTVDPAEPIFYSLIERLKELPQQGDSLLVIKITDSLHQEALARSDDRMIWFAALYQKIFLSRNYHHYSYKDQLVFADTAKFDAAPFNEVRAMWWYHLGSYFHSRKQVDRAYRYYIKAEELAERIGYEKIPGIVYFLDELFHLHYQIGDYPAALLYLRRLLQQDRPFLGHRRKTYHLGNLGETYLSLNNIPKAKEAFQQSIALAKQTGDTVWVGISSGNYGHALQREGRYREALPYLYADIALNEKRIPGNTAITYLFLANSLLRLDSVEKAGECLRKALLLGPDWQFSRFGLYYYEIKALYHQKRGDYHAAFVYQDSLLRLRDSLRAKNDVAQFKFIALRSREQKLLAAQKEQELEARQMRLSRNVIIGFLLLLFVAIILYSHRKRQQEKAQLLQRQQEAEEKLRQSEEKLAAYVQTIREKNRLIEQIERQLEENTAAGPGEATGEPGPQALANITLLTEKDWLQFKTLFTAVYPQFLPQLQEKYPALSPAETRLLALQKLGLSSKEVSGVLGISPESLRKSRYRLRKKYPELLQDDQQANDEEV